MGPRSVISALMDNVALPAQIQSPMLNLAMRDLIICLSSFETQEKVRSERISHIPAVLSDGPAKGIFIDLLGKFCQIFDICIYSTMRIAI